MKRTRLVTFLVGVALFDFQSGLNAWAQEPSALNSGQTLSQTGFTGTGEESSRTMAAKPARADGLGNPLLGGERHPLYRLQPSDVLEISFAISPEFDQTLTIQPDGYISLKNAGSIQAQGMTLQELCAAVGHAYEGYLHEPEVAISLKEFERPHFTVGGEVGRPGKYELRSDTTVAEAVQIAGGFTSQSKHSRVVLFRRVHEDLVETRIIDLKKMLKTGLQEDSHLQPGDFVFVPQNRISKIAHFMTRPSMSMYVNSSQF